MQRRSFLSTTMCSSPHGTTRLSGARVVRRAFLSVLGACLALACGPTAEEVSASRRALTSQARTLLPLGSTWRYLDDGTDPGLGWKDATFADGAWKTGKAQFGYGEADEATVVSFGADPKNRHLTTYFRTVFFVDNPTVYSNLILRVLSDDGAAVFLNGTEVYREDLPPGFLNSKTLSPKAAVENLYIQRIVSAKHLVPGRNLLAVEVHQDSVDSADMSFDLSLAGTESVALVRGPYLQSGAPTRAILRWRTDVESIGWVRYGRAADALDRVATEVKASTEHTVAVEGLLPGTRYYYSIGTPEGVLAGEDRDHFFVTPPKPGERRPIRIWAIGDSGLANAPSAGVRDAYKAFTGARHTDLWLMLGDNAYNEGTDDQYQKAVFELFPEQLRSLFLWPCLGNHEYYGSPGKPEGMAYLSIFTLPTKGEAGGVASGTELYYSYDFGDAHFVVLDSMASNRTPGAPMLAWLEEDLQQSQRSWLIAYWHHPPYSKGSHDSDTEGELIEMRENVVPLLERHGVDLVLGGHSHTYERSVLLSGHHGTSSSLTKEMKLNAGSGRRDEGGPYVKMASGPGAAGGKGAVFVVAGSAAIVSPGYPLNHPVMHVNLERYGSLVVDIDGDELDATFLRETGAIDDRFAIRKVPRALPAADAGRPAGHAGADAAATRAAPARDAGTVVDQAAPIAIYRRPPEGSSGGCTVGRAGRTGGALGLLAVSFLAGLSASRQARGARRRSE
jgi:hypothetical protein